VQRLTHEWAERKAARVREVTGDGSGHALPSLRSDAEWLTDRVDDGEG